MGLRRGYWEGDVEGLEILVGKRIRMWRSVWSTWSEGDGISEVRIRKKTQFHKFGLKQNIFLFKIKNTSKMKIFKIELNVILIDLV